ncbi:hypothetical protein L596_005504 [Steinernema carpocapsae]|uniref:Uncharacterized protein n=1 Tax=Steinernema carpocapsae TaxID=34508 RepID=A0A4U8V0N9_STECR|nr:hypothetical protein L596_005504 [Steinernema carpocapsae]
MDSQQAVLSLLLPICSSLQTSLHFEGLSLAFSASIVRVEVNFSRPERLEKLKCVRRSNRSGRAGIWLSANLAYFVVLTVRDGPRLPKMPHTEEMLSSSVINGAARAIARGMRILSIKQALLRKRLAEYGTQIRAAFVSAAVKDATIGDRSIYTLDHINLNDLNSTRS